MAYLLQSVIAINNDHVIKYDCLYIYWILDKDVIWFKLREFSIVLFENNNGASFTI